MGVLMKDFLRRFFTLPALRWLVARAVKQMTDEQVERDMWKQLGLEIIQIVGLSVASFVVLVNFVFTTGINDAVGPVLPSNETVIARQPGPDFDTAAWCKSEGVTNVPQKVDNQIELKRGVEGITWVYSLNADTGAFTWTGSDGAFNGPVGVKMTADAKSCFKSKAGK